MKVLFATELTQGLWDGDYYFCKPGELVHLNIGCDTNCVARTRELCGTCRAFCGFGSLKGTTTAIVRETDMTLAELVMQVRRSFAVAGFDLKYARATALDIAAVAGAFSDGHVIQRGPSHITARGFAVTPDAGDGSDVFVYPQN